MTRIAFVTASPPQAGWQDDRIAADALDSQGVEVEFRGWRDPSVAWDRFDRVVVRSTWDYFDQVGEFVAWADEVGPAVLRNRPEVIRWSSDKRYLAELAGSGLPVPPTTLLAPGNVPEFDHPVVVKPVVGGAGRSVGMFGPDHREAMLHLIERIWEGGGTVMVQPYLEQVEEAGETAVCMFGGEVSHVLKKGAFLPAGEAAPVGQDGTAEALLDPALVVPGEADGAELALAHRTMAWLADRFGTAPLLARIDMIPSGRSGPWLVEVELIEPHFYFEADRDAGGSGAERFAEAVMADIG